MSGKKFVEAERMYVFHCPNCGADSQVYELGDQECEHCEEEINVYHETDE